MTKDITVNGDLIEDALNLLIDITFEHGSEVNVAQMDRVVRGLVEARKEKRDGTGIRAGGRVGKPFRFPSFCTVPRL